MATRGHLKNIAGSSSTVREAQNTSGKGTNDDFNVVRHKILEHEISLLPYVVNKLAAAGMRDEAKKTIHTNKSSVYECTPVVLSVIIVRSYGFGDHYNRHVGPDKPLFVFQRHGLATCRTEVEKGTSDVLLPYTASDVYRDSPSL
jgi:hypothetical protein